MAITKKIKSKTYNTQKKLSTALKRVSENSSGYSAHVSSAQSSNELSPMFRSRNNDLLSIKDAAMWATEYLGKNVTPYNYFKEGTL